MKLPLFVKYILRDVLSVFFLFLSCFYALYVLIDYTSHMGNFLPFQKQGGLLLFFEYYVYIFITRINLLIPLAFLIALLRTLCLLNIHRELFALLSGGISIYRITAPFLCLSLLFTTLVYANEQFLSPHAQKKLKELEEVHKIEKRKRTKKPLVRSLLLKDKTKLLFQSYEATQERFFDAYWIRFPKEIYRFQYLHPYETTPRGQHVDLFTRTSQNTWEFTQHFEEKTFPEIVFDREILYGTLTPATDLSLSELWKLKPQHHRPFDERESILLSTLYWKCSVPWLCLFVVLIPIPMCVRFQRDFSLFLIYLGSLFGLIAFYLLLNALTVMAKRQVLTPFFAIGPLFFLTFAFGIYQFTRMRITQ